jgi:uncharacterized membrane protein
MMPILGALAIGAGGGAALGSVLAARKGAIIGALVGAGGSALYAYALSSGISHGAYPLILLAALGCGLMAGFFFAFSAVVMESLAQQPQTAGMATMQTINVVVFNPWFGTAFIGTAVACVLVMIFALSRWHDPGMVYAFVGALLYLVGTLLVTALFNVPRNDTLAAVAPTARGAADLWSSYLTSWTIWNHARTAAALAAAALLTVALAAAWGK